VTRHVPADISGRSERVWRNPAGAIRPASTSQKNTTNSPKFLSPTRADEQRRTEMITNRRTHRPIALRCVKADE
jgi:hypothetical protein